MVGQPYPVVGQGVQIPVSGGQYFVPAQWPNGNEEYNYNLQNYPAQYYGRYNFFLILDCRRIFFASSR